MPSVRPVVQNETVATVDHQSFPVDLVSRCSKDEVVSLLGLMHRLLLAEEQRAIDALLIDLSKFIRESLIALPALPPTLSCPVMLHDKPYLLSDYMLSLLIHVQSRFEKQPPSRRTRQALSPRELTVLRWMKEGKTNWEIARIIGLSERTVRFHVGGILRKLGVASRTQAVVFALGAGLITS